MPNWIWYLVIVIVAYIYFRHWTRYIYYQGMKDGMAISDGINRGENMEHLEKRYDRYKTIK